jgi:WhiB family redox-sensing transcriptional regulator
MADLGHRVDWIEGNLNWQRQAACADAPAHLFFPGAGGKGYRPGLAYCRRCPVRVECLDYALGLPAEEDHGLWGGLVPEQRVYLRDHLPSGRSTKSYLWQYLRWHITAPCGPSYSGRD